MKKIRILGGLSLASIVLLLFIFNGLYSKSTQSVSEAKRLCGNKVWVIEADSPFSSVFEVNIGSNYEAKDLVDAPSSDGWQSYNCTEGGAKRIVSFERFILLYGAFSLIAAGTILWWAYIEIKNARRHK